ncbi:MAG TPA: hypothetical protein VK171_04795 [Fimbriimonas sp.]|nr:hypothetical protein [Fimbriimonas sp.]
MSKSESDGPSLNSSLSSSLMEAVTLQAISDALELLNGTGIGNVDFAAYFRESPVESWTYIADGLSSANGFHSMDPSEFLEKVELGTEVRALVDYPDVHLLLVPTVNLRDWLKVDGSCKIILPSEGANWLILDTVDDCVPSRLIFRQN